MSCYTIEIENCNSIESTSITIVKETLNIKYGSNGLGKSTIARAIIAAVANDGSLQNLKPFKYRGIADQFEPVVRGVENIGSVLVFDDSYVSQFAFQRDEVLKNSFDILDSCIFTTKNRFKALVIEDFEDGNIVNVFFNEKVDKII